MRYFFIFCSIGLLISAQTLLKWRLNCRYADVAINFRFLLSAISDIYIIGYYFLALAASIFWVLAVKQLPLSVAFAFTSLNFILIFLVDKYVFHENVNFWHWFGAALIIGGVLLISIKGGSA